ncbi:MAG: acetate--CoA ligase family protein [Methanomassiliicoccales archaeon]|nr:acetate--CoA ligase family protein [Methanomassiliicoccales archaeon]
MTGMESASRVLSEAETKRLLKARGILTTKFALPRRSELGDLPLSYPLAVKVSSAKVLHKTEVGGLFLDVMTPEELLRRYDQITTRFPDADVLVESMEPKGPEVIVGVLHDKDFGPCIMFGMGGVMAELYKDVSFRRLPITKRDAEEMLGESKGSAFFQGFRGFVADKEAMLDLLSRVSSLAMEMRDLEQLDLNPVILREDGYVVVDAKMVLKER